MNLDKKWTHYFRYTTLENTILDNKTVTPRPSCVFSGCLNFVYSNEQCLWVMKAS
jgi:hypothetical protein